jgi:hypothetical protein
MQITYIAEQMRGRAGAGASRRVLLLATLIGLSGVAACKRMGAGTAGTPRAADAAASTASSPQKSLYSVVPESVRL